MYIKVTVTPEAKKEKFTKVSNDHFTAAVKEPAKNNAANRRVVELVALHFGLSPAKVKIVTGHRSRSKILSI